MEQRSRTLANIQYILEMAYNNKNFLKKVYEINTIADKYIKEGISNETIYWRYIYPQYHISRTTFYAYLKTDYSEYLEDIDNEND